MAPLPSSETKVIRGEGWQRESKSHDKSAAVSDWVSRQVEAMASAWAQAKPISVEQLLADHPELSSEQAVRLIYEDICLRREAGLDVPTDEIVSRFPQWKSELEILLDCDRLLRPLSRAAVFPEVGERLGPFRLISELGRGASGKTYLAIEPGLAGRLVVLKVSSDDQDEHLSLARLQHTHIVPLYSEHTFPDRALRALCMPYCGGASLARLLEALSETPVHERTGRHLLEAVDRCQHSALPSADDGPYRRYLNQASYVQAVCWIVSCLADALHEAHSRGLVHMDVKPSNLLIAGDGLPMLLDFHLARKPIKPGERPSDRLGGTPGWMAPEQEAALKALSQGQSISKRVDHRADLYSLGLLLCETLAGPSARALAADGEPWSHCNPQVSIGLSDIVAKCLARSPHERYHDAASLADDLRRHLNDSPLRGVANRSFRERWYKWRRRKPIALARGVAWFVSLAVLGTATVAGAAFYQQRLREIETDLEDGKKSRVDHHFAEAARVLSRGLECASAIPTPADLRNKLDRELRLARRGQKAGELRHLADLARFWYGISPPVGEDARRFVEKVRALWKARSHLLNLPGEDLDPEVERGIRTDLLELAIVWANLRQRLVAHSEAAEACRDALSVLDEASTLCGPSPALLRERRACLATLNHAQTAHEPELPLQPDPPAQTPWEHYDLGRSYLRSGLIARAAQEFQLTLQSRPQDFWPNFYQGLCAYEQGQFEEAVAAFRTCIALAPESAECYYNRARAEDSLNRKAQAQSDYTRALELDPGMAVAALNRGILAYKTGRPDQALADLKSALENASDTMTVGRVHYNLALVYKAQGERAKALASARQAVARGYKEAASLRDNLERGR